MKSEAVVAILASEDLAQVAVSSQHARRCFVSQCLRPDFFFSGVLTTLIRRSPREGVDTCRDRALNASGQGYYGEAKVDRAAKAGHKYLHNKLSYRDVSSRRFFL